mgnify:CR=1 FL=1
MKTFRTIAIVIATVATMAAFFSSIGCEKETVEPKTTVGSALKSFPVSATAAPNAPTNITVALNNGVVYIEWQIVGANDSTKFEVTPIFVKGNAQTRLASSIWGNRFAVLSGPALKDSAIALGGGNTAKYKFGVKTIQGTEVSSETISQTLNIK